MSTHSIGIILLFCSVTALGECLDPVAAYNYFKKVDSFESLYAGYIRYQECDDGFVADEISSRVTDLVTNNFCAFIGNEKSYRDPDYMDFILRHLDELMSWPDFEKLDLAVRKECLNENPLEECELFLEKLDYLRKLHETGTEEQ